MRDKLFFLLSPRRPIRLFSSTVLFVSFFYAFLGFAEVKPVSFTYTLAAASHPKMLSKPVYFPEILEIWWSRPLSFKDFFLDYPLYASSENIHIQRKIFRVTTSPLVRSRTVMQLAHCNNHDAIPLLCELQKTETDELVLADILRVLKALSPPVTPPLPWSRLFELAAPAHHRLLRISAMSLMYHPQAAMAMRLHALLQQEKDPDIRFAGWTRLADEPRAIPAEDWIQLSRDSVSALRRVAITALCRLAFPASVEDRLIALCRSESEEDRFAVAAGITRDMPPALAGKLLALLNQDSPSVRAQALEVTAAIGCQEQLPALRLALQNPSLFIRQVAAAGLGNFPDQKTAEALFRGLRTFSNPNLLQACQESLIKISKTIPLEPGLLKLMAAPSRSCRLSVYRICRERPFAKLTVPLGRALAREQDPALLCALIDALCLLDAREYRESILKFSNHESSLVRAPVALAIGKMKLSGGYPFLKKAALTDPEHTVREAATQAMGYTGDSTFSPVLLKILQSVRMSKDNLVSAPQRSIACWSIARLDKLDKSLRLRLVKQITRPVIPTMMGPTFEGDSVRFSACMALVEQARQSESEPIMRAARRMVELLQKPPDENAAFNPGQVPPSSPLLRDYAYQAACLLDKKKTIIRHEPPINKIRFRFRRLENRP